ncbi:hypothetical protein BH20ACI2_BH20ACI2_08800 [soil metagenome]
MEKARLAERPGFHLEAISKHYGVLVVLGEAILFGDMVLPVFVLVVFDGIVFVIAGVISGVMAGAVVIVLFAVIALAGRFALMFTLVDVSPQAMPIALNPRTVESTITFFILFRLLIFLKDFFTYLI